MDHLVNYFGTTVLSWLVAVPALAALIVAFLPRGQEELLKRFAVGMMGLEFLISLFLLMGDYTTAQFQFTAAYPLVESLGIQYKVGIDGIALWLVMLTTFVTPLALYASWSHVKDRVKEFIIAFLLLETAMIGAFVSLDVFVFYIFWELMLVPMYLIIGVWGGADRVYASVKFFLFTMFGSLLMFVAILYVVVQYQGLSGEYTFDITQLSKLIIERDAQILLFTAFALAFAIKVPMFPFHTWLPDAHVQAPTGGSVILAAVMLKLGTYGFIRFAIPLFPLAAFVAGPTLALLAVTGIIYGAWCAWVQKDVKKLVAYSSVSHLGFCMLGIFSATQQGVAGSILQMVSHGISTGALFLLVGVIYDRRHTRLLSEFGGLAKVMPLYTLLFVIVTMSSVGLPGTNGFIGEFMILNGTFVSERLPGPFVFTLLAATGVILAAIYMLHAVLKMFWGELNNEENKELSDMTGREFAVLAPFIVLIFAIGFFPGPFLDKMNPSVQQYLNHYNAKLLANANEDKETRLWEGTASLTPVGETRLAKSHAGEGR